MATTFKSAAECYARAQSLSRCTCNEYSSTVRKREQWGAVPTIEQLRCKDVREFLE